MLLSSVVRRERTSTAHVCALTAHQVMAGRNLCTPPVVLVLVPAHLPRPRCALHARRLPLRCPIDVQMDLMPNQEMFGVVPEPFYQDRTLNKTGIRDAFDNFTRTGLPVRRSRLLRHALLGHAHRGRGRGLL